MRDAWLDAPDTRIVAREFLERVTGIEPAPPAWKAGALPLSYTREVHKGSGGVSSV